MVEVRRLTYGLFPLISTTEGALRRSAEVCLERLIVPTAPLRALVTRFDLDPPATKRPILGRMVYIIYSFNSGHLVWSGSSAWFDSNGGRVTSPAHLIISLAISLCMLATEAARDILRKNVESW